MNEKTLKLMYLGLILFIVLAQLDCLLVLAMGLVADNMLLAGSSGIFGILSLFYAAIRTEYLYEKSRSST